MLARNNPSCKVDSGHLHSTVDLGKIAIRHLLGGLEADTKLEASRAPVNELDGALGLERGDGTVSILGDDITTVQQAGSHIFAISGVTLDHLVIGLEARHGHLLDGVGLVSSLGGGDDGRVGDQREVDTGVWHQVGLELVQVDVQGSIETQRSGDRGNNCNRVSNTTMLGFGAHRTNPERSSG